MPALSVIIITYNEERNIGRCLESLGDLPDEVVVVDSFSTDATARICEAHGVRFVQHPFGGYIEQKNYALSLAIHPQVLSLDADEALSDELRHSLVDAKAYWPADGYTMNRLTNYCGQWIRHSGWYPDRKLRLFDRRLGYWGGTNPHDRLEMPDSARAMHLAGDLLHYSYYSVDEHLKRARKYAQIAAEAMHSKGQRSTYAHVVLSPVFKFFRNYLLKGGFLDGRAGWTICRIAALETYWKYSLLREIQGAR